MALRAWTGCESVVSTGSLTKIPSGQEAQNLLTFHQDGLAHCWDLSGRERLFSFTTPVTLVAGRFSPHRPHTGALLSDLGDLIVFSVLEGGQVKPAPPMPCSVVDVAWTEDRLVCLDENGALWVVDDSAEKVGGTWSGWSTTALSLDSKRTAVGTADGSIVIFDESGSSSVPPLSCHQDAVVALYRFKDRVVSVGADCTVCLLTINDVGLQLQRSISERAGVSVVSSCWDETQQELYLALEEGEILWLNLESGSISGSLKLEDHRIEEVILGGLPGQILVLTDRGSLKKLDLQA